MERVKNKNCVRQRLKDTIHQGTSVINRNSLSSSSATHYKNKCGRKYSSVARIRVTSTVFAIAALVFYFHISSEPFYSTANVTSSHETTGTDFVTKQDNIVIASSSINSTTSVNDTSTANVTSSHETTGTDFVTKRDNTIASPSINSTTSVNDASTANANSASPDKPSGPIIDAVFTFVNGSDPKLIAQMKHYGKVDPERVRDIGQLRYAMRSAFTHAPFIRNFIIVVSDKQTQTPSWLNSMHPRVRIVEHKEIFNKTSYLPSMNADAIEWAIVNIPDLAPVYLYFNDDFAIQTKLELSSIWRAPKFVLWEAWEAPRKAVEVEDTYGKSLAFVRQLYDQKYGVIRSRRVGSHVPMLFDIAVMKKIMDDFPQEFEDMFRHNPFRYNHNMQIHFAYQQYIRHHFPYEMASDSHVHWLNLQNNIAHNERVFAEIKKEPRQFICLQDAFGNSIASRQVVDQIDKLYKEIFPVKGPWEILD